MLKLINPLYRNISIDDSPAMREALNSITSQLLLKADVMEDDIDAMNDLLAVPPNVTNIPAGDARIGRITPTIFVCVEIYTGCFGP